MALEFAAQRRDGLGDQMRERRVHSLIVGVDDRAHAVFRRRSPLVRFEVAEHAAIARSPSTPSRCTWIIGAPESIPPDAAGAAEYSA